jgi:hypothetical protein
MGSPIRVSSQARSEVDREVPERLHPDGRGRARMTNERLIHLAEACSSVRSSIGRMLLSEEMSDERVAALETYRRSMRMLLQLAREEECGVFLEVAGELS